MFCFIYPITSLLNYNRLTSGAGCAGRGELLVLGDTGTAGSADGGGLLGSLGSLLDLPMIPVSDRTLQNALNFPVCLARNLLDGIGGGLGLGGLLLLEEVLKGSTNDGTLHLDGSAHSVKQYQCTYMQQQ